MHKITFVSTMHEEMGKCNADELCKIIERIDPEVVFLEALDDTYSNYQKFLHSSFGVYHRKLEIKAIQKYGRNYSFKFIPVLDNELSDAFKSKSHLLEEHVEFRKLLNDFNCLAREHGFPFLNSAESIRLHEEMRILGNRILIDSERNKIANEDIDAYENSMIHNVYSYSQNEQFDSAIFMCGVAHRKSIIEKVGKFNRQEDINLNWVIFEG